MCPHFRPDPWSHLTPSLHCVSHVCLFCDLLNYLTCLHHWSCNLVHSCCFIRQFLFSLLTTVSWITSRLFPFLACLGESYSLSLISYIWSTWYHSSFCLYFTIDSVINANLAFSMVDIDYSPLLLCLPDSSLPTSPNFQSIGFSCLKRLFHMLLFF